MNDAINDTHDSVLGASVSPLPQSLVVIEDDAAPPCEVSSTVRDVKIDKTAIGFGIYFTKRTSLDGRALLVVDGFVEHIVPRDISDNDSGEDDTDETPTDANAAEMTTTSAASASAEPPLANVLQLGDALVGINSAACDAVDPLAVVDLLRAAPLGPNVLQFQRVCASHPPSIPTTTISTTTTATTTKDNCSGSASTSITSSLLGALRKVTTKLKEGIDDSTADSDALLAREQFEYAWLAEFKRLQHEYASKWATCTYTADAFCGLLYQSGDPQQQAYLLREYPLLMEAWRDASKINASAQHWPAPRVSYTETITYCSSPTDGDGTAAQSSHAACIREILAPPALHRALDALRSEFAWRRGDVRALEQQLAASDVYSCCDLARVLEARSGYFERRFQSAAYPRLTSAICRSLLAHARHGAKTFERGSAY